MKKIIVTLITLFALSAFAQTAETVEKAPLNYLKALQSSNDAVVSSAIFYVVKLQMFYPETRDNQNHNLGLYQLSYDHHF